MRKINTNRVNKYIHINGSENVKKDFIINNHDVYGDMMYSTGIDSEDFDKKIVSEIIKNY